MALMPPAGHGTGSATMFDPSQWNRLVTWFATMAFGALAGYAYTRVAYDTIPVEILQTLPGLRAGLLLAGASSAFELFVMRGDVERWFARRTLLQALGLRVLIHTAIVVLCLLANRALSGLLIGYFVPNAFDLWDIGQDVVYSFLVVALVLFVLQMRTLIGARTLANVVLGRYRRPVRENRVFVLFDLTGSTPLAGRVGDERFHEFLSAFFHEIDAAVTRCGGEIYSYVGDAMFVSWPMGTPPQNARAVRAVFAARHRLLERAPWFENEFGQAANFRAVIHGGPIVAGECGDSRRQVTYLGDVLNTTARLEALAKERDVGVLISRPILAVTDLPGDVSAADLGAHHLKGVAEPIAVSALHGFE